MDFTDPKNFEMMNKIMFSIAIAAKIKPADLVKIVVDKNAQLQYTAELLAEVAKANTMAAKEAEKNALDLIKKAKKK